MMVSLCASELIRVGLARLKNVLEIEGNVGPGRLLDLVCKNLADYKKSQSISSDSRGTSNHDFPGGRAVNSQDVYVSPSLLTFLE